MKCLAKNLEQRLSEIRVTIERMDFRCDGGFITDKADYLEKRLRLQQELEQLTPVQDELEMVVELLEHFAACNGDGEKQHELVKMIVDRVYVQDGNVAAMTLKSDYHVILGKNANGPTDMPIDPAIHEWARRDSNP